MSERCAYESEVLRASGHEHWSDELREHLASCEDCVAAASVAPWIARFEKVSMREHRLPNPSLIWIKAQLLQGSADARRATRPLDVLQLIAYVVVAGGWAALLTWRWPAVETWLRGFTAVGVVQNAASQPLSVSLFGFVFVLASMTVMLALHTILAEE